METTSFLHFVETPASFFPSSGKLFFKEIIIFGQWKRSLGLIMVSTRRKKAVYKRILFPIDRNSYSTSQNEGLIKNIRFHYTEKLLSPAGISKKATKIWFPVVGETLLYKKWIHLNLNNGFH